MSPKSSALTIHWRDCDSKNYIDLLPKKWFAAEGSFLGLTHPVKGPQGGESKAMCNIKVRGTVAELDYRPFREYNLRHGNILGVLRLQFADSGRRTARAVHWKGPNDTSFSPGDAEIGRAQIQCPPSDRAQRLLDLIVHEIRRGRFVPGKPDTYLGYKEVHVTLGLRLKAGTWGQSLQQQGLDELATWVQSRRLPALTGLIVDKTKRRRPGHGYFVLFNHGREDVSWWHREVRRAIEHDWSSCTGGERPPTRRELRAYFEGKRGKVSLQTRRRCEALRRQAKLHFRSSDGELQCAACGWARPQPGLRSDIVEIHHILPVSRLAPEGAEWTNEKALKLLAPLCPNCHRVAHSRPEGGVYSLRRLREVVVQVSHPPRGL